MSSIVLNIIKILQTLCGSRKDSVIVPQSNEMQIVLPAIPQTPSTPTQIMYQEDTTNSTMSTSKDDLGHGKRNIFICCIYWSLLPKFYRKRWFSCNGLDSVDYNKSSN